MATTTYFIRSAVWKFGDDGRNLMRSEIGELSEAFEEGQVGSSTMAHKRNPVNFENLKATWLKNQRRASQGHPGTQ